MVGCAAFGCNNNFENKKTSDTSFHSFPKKKQVLKKWIFFCKRKDIINVKSARLCSLHFLKDDFSNNAEYEMGFTCRRVLKPDAVPKVHVNTTKVDAPAKIASQSSRSKKMAARKNKEDVQSILDALEPNAPHDPQGHENDAAQKTKQLQFDEMAKEMLINKEQLTKVEEENLFLQKSLLESKKKISELEIQLQKTNCQKDNIENKLLQIFTKGQVKKLQNPLKKMFWSEEDITKSITLYSTSSKAYKLLRRKNFPLPAPRTLQFWVQKLQISPAILNPVV